MSVVLLILLLHGVLQAPGATVSGRVVAGDTGAPIKGAVVTISSTADGVRQSANTDDLGRYEFRGLAPGSYRLGAVPGQHRAQYLSLRYGGRGPADPGTLIDVIDGQKIERADIVLPRAAVILGRVTDEGGEPLARVPVQALQVRNGRPQRIGTATETDDLGQFRVFALSPGEYLVAADIRPGSSSAAGETQGFITTFHPGTVSPADALRVRVKPGEEAAADIRLIRSRLFRIAGTIVNRRGDPVPRASLSLVRQQFTTQMGFASVTVDAQGRFSMGNLPPGEYRLLVRDRTVANEAAGIKEFASADVRLDQADVTDLTLVTAQGTIIQGAVVFEPQAPPDPQLRIGASGDRLSAMTGATGAMADEDTFVIPDVFGPAIIRAEVTRPRGWTLKAVRLRGRDITDLPTEFTSADVDQVEIVFTARGGRIDGRVIDEGGIAVGGNVVLFGEDPATWVTRSSMFRIVGIDKSGTFSLEGLRPGNYLVVALPRARSFNVIDAGRDLFEPLAADATRVEVGEGEHRSVVLRPLEVR